MFEKLKKSSRANGSAFKRRSVPVAVLLILAILLSASSGYYAGASFFAQQAPNVTVTTTIFTTTTSWTTSTIWSIVTQVIQDVLTTVQYTTSTNTITVTAGAATSTTAATAGTSTSMGTFGDKAVEPMSANNFGWIEGHQYTIGSPVTVQSISVYVVNAQNFRLAIYDHDPSNKKPNNLLVESASTNCGTGNAWCTIPVNPTYLAAGTYWLMLQHQSNTSAYKVKFTAGGYEKKQLYGAFPNPFGSGDSPPLELSLYATYSVTLSVNIPTVSSISAYSDAPVEYTPTAVTANAWNAFSLDICVPASLTTRAQERTGLFSKYVPVPHS